MRLKSKLLAGLIAVSFGVAGGMATAQDKVFLKAETNAVGTWEHLILATFVSNAQSANEHLNIQFTSGVPGTRSHVNAGKGDVHMTQIAPSIMSWMVSQTRMYADLAEAPELQDNLRTVFNYKFGVNQWVTFADSGIESLDDIRGKKLFAGPHGSAAAGVAQGVLQADTGMVAGDDYELVNLDWPSGPQALIDGQIDVFMRPTNLPSADIQQIATMRPIRLLGWADATLNSEGLQAEVAVPGTTPGIMPVGVYEDRQVNEADVNVIAYWAGVGVHKDVSDDVVYAMTKAWWENAKNFYKANPGSEASLGPVNAFSELYSPLHPGALRYYEEMGFDIPATAYELKP